MKKNDKLVVILGVLILVIASIGVYYWVPEKDVEHGAEAEDFFSITGTISSMPEAITVSDESPFYALIATPLAAHYDADGELEIIPLYIRNFEDPSRAIERVKDQIYMRIDELIIDGSYSAKEVSLEIAQDCWESSEGVLLIEGNESGYNLGVMATPLASYLSIPVIVTDEIDQDVIGVLSDLGVEYSLVCGDIEGYGNVLRFDTVEEIVDVTIELLLEKFGEIDYVTIANPVDAWPPEVLDSVHYSYGPVTVGTGATTMFVKQLTGGSKPLGDFTIPKDYKYALVKFEGINLHPEDVSLLGDYADFKCGPTGDVETPAVREILSASTANGGIPVRDSNGNIIADKVYTESILYDRGGMEYFISASGCFLATESGEVAAEVTIEKLSDSVYPMMKGLSQVAPYLTAYHKGVIFGKPEFAFTANDDILYMGEPSPGYYMPRLNPRLLPASNNHVFEIHKEINKVLARIAGVDFEKEYDVKNLQNHYENNPINVALCGGATVIPQLIYDCVSATSEVTRSSPSYGPGTPSDFIYGNIDPKIGDWSQRAPDLYSDNEFPFQENAVGRITGWDVQDACALVLRTVFYDEIINKMGDWKDNAAVLMGGGTDFKKPFIMYKIYGEILDKIKHGEPMKLDTGQSYFGGLTLAEELFEDEMGFETTYIRENAATYKGLTEEAINKLKNANLLNKIIMSARQLRNELGTNTVIGGDTMESSNFIFANAHGSYYMFGMGDVGLWSIGWGLPNGILTKYYRNFYTPINTWGPGMSFMQIGNYNTRNVEGMNFGPSVLWIESCICGKIDGIYPKVGISQACLHAGVNAVFAATTLSNVPAGYNEPKRTKYDFPGQTLYRYIKTKMDTNKGIYPDPHFGDKVFTDLCEELENEEGMTTGMAYRNARNRYLPEDIGWEMWWTPPLGDGTTTTSVDLGFGPYIDNKWVTFHEFVLYGDPAFEPYIP